MKSVSEVETTIHSSLHSTYQDITGPSLWIFTVSSLSLLFSLVSSSFACSQSARFSHSHRSAHRRFLFLIFLIPRPNRLQRAPNAPSPFHRVRAGFQLSNLHPMPLYVVSKPNSHRSHRFGEQSAGSAAPQCVVDSSD